MSPIIEEETAKTKKQKAKEVADRLFFDSKRRKDQKLKIIQKNEEEFQPMPPPRQQLNFNTIQNNGRTSQRGEMAPQNKSFNAAVSPRSTIQQSKKK